MDVMKIFSGFLFARKPYSTSDVESAVIWDLPSSCESVKL